MGILDLINEPNDIKKIPEEDYRELAKEIRRFLIKKVSNTGGHLASNLGTVELTMALHLFLDFPEDKLIFDVGHQSYTHKLLTGRKNGFDNLRQFGGMSGFPNRKESPCDAFNTGHASTSISVADGIVKARDLKGEKYKVVAVIGDGALSGGMAFEALNNAGRLKSNMIIVLNDNKMSISENVGGMAAYLGKLRTNQKYTGLKMNIEEKLKTVPYMGEKMVKRIKTSKESIKSLFVPGMLFENMGITYIGPIDGHNIPLMLDAFEAAAQSKNPVLVHVITKKGKGYAPAEKDPASYHGVEPFYCSTGEKKTAKSSKTYTDIFSETIVGIGESNANIVAITAAMADGTGLKEWSERFPNRFFDVGIAEEHAVTFAAGMASAGIHPVVAVYSTFLQRSFDQLVHDVALNFLPVTICVDRAGIVGCDGETHQGIFDLSYLSEIPGFAVMAPKNAKEFADMIVFACNYNGPSAIRYPRAKAYYGCETENPIVLGKAEVLRKGEKAAVIAVGKMVKVMDGVLDELEEEGLKLTFVNARFINPIDFEMIDRLCETHDIIITAEENVKRGGFGEAVAEYILEKGRNIKYLNISLPDSFLPHGIPRDIRDSIGFNPETIKNKIKKSIDEC
ncbi:MAG: 1-deoxy-D-xylulose-5-phosphate synthase [Lachnospiraceae bacterium]|nr:1-deoxy-D-xylulose-5-phosphate synthase [Lachnospiraceae bacterium]